MNRPDRTFRVAAISSRNVRRIWTGVYEYSPKRGWKWLQRVAFWFLRKIGAQAWETTTIYTRTEQEHDDFLASLFQQNKAWRDLIWDGRAAHIYMGPQDEADLCFKIDMQPYTVVAEARLGRDSERRIFNVPITVVPWMVGAVIVPATTKAGRP